MTMPDYTRDHLGAALGTLVDAARREAEDCDYPSEAMEQVEDAEGIIRAALSDPKGGE